MKKNNLKQTVLLDGSAVADEYSVEMFPTVFFIDRDGNVAEVLVGAEGPRSLERGTRKILRGS